MKFVFLFSFLFFLSSIANAIEVGGHLTEDTVWSPENNPYEVTENLFVNSGVTLTILPGTEVKLQAKPLTSYADFYQSFCYPNNTASMIWVDGRIIAVGTEQDSIRFTKLQNEQDHFWGCLYFSEQSDMPVFKYVDFQYSAGISIAVGQLAEACITVDSSDLLVNNCYFRNNAASLLVGFDNLENVEITDCRFNYNPSSSFVEHLWGGYHCNITSPADTYKPPLFANNQIYAKFLSLDSVFYVFNSFSTSINGINIGDDPVYGIDYFFNNEFINCTTGIRAADNNVYIKNNSFIGGDDAIDIDDAYVEIRDNYFNNCDLSTGFDTSGMICNNYNDGGAVYAPGITHFSSNISFNNNSGIGICATYQRLSSTNNVSINNQYAFEASYSFDNCIFLGNDELEEYSVTGSPIFRNCIIDFPLDPPLVDGGGNIIVDSAEVGRIFENIENGDFHLAANSIAIDAGYDTLGYYYPFDLENSVRVWDGAGDGNAVIDIGAYEYGAPQLGKISGYITKTESGEPVDYVLIKADNEPGEFTFADSSGYFEIQLPEGTYDLYAERVFYEDNIIYTVTVENEQTTEIEFNMTYNDPLVGINYNELNINNSGLETSNYPNPFNPTTTISFNLAIDSDVSVEVYNVKGQKVKTLINEEMFKGKHSVNWDGINENNKSVSSGVYLYKVKAGNQESVKRMILLK